MRVEREWLGVGFMSLLLLFSSCAPMVVGTGAVATGMIGERRGASEYVDDNWAALKIRSAYYQSPIVKVSNINVSVYQGRALLTGAAASETEIQEAVRIAKGTRGVLEVSSEIKVQSETSEEIAKDAWISTQVKARFFADTVVRAIDIHVETTKGVVYLTGRAATVVERNQAVALARMVQGVVEVVSYIDVDYVRPPPVPFKDSGSPSQAL